MLTQVIAILVLSYIFGKILAEKAETEKNLLEKQLKRVRIESEQERREYLARIKTLNDTLGKR